MRKPVKAVPVAPEQYDVLITCANNNDDISLATLIKGQFMSVLVPHNNGH